LTGGWIRVRGFYADSSSQKAQLESVVYVPLKNTPLDFDGRARPGRLPSFGCDLVYSGLPPPGR
jgi:hypothetical protein